MAPRRMGAQAIHPFLPRVGVGVGQRFHRSMMPWERERASGRAPRVCGLGTATGAGSRCRLPLPVWTTLLRDETDAVDAKRKLAGGGSPDYLQSLSQLPDRILLESVASTFARPRRDRATGSAQHPQSRGGLGTHLPRTALVRALRGPDEAVCRGVRLQVQSLAL